MSEGEDRSSQRNESFRWESVGRAAEDFARQVARDAARFAERIETHASDLARDVGREWRRSVDETRRDRGSEREDVHRVFAGVRLVIDDVLDGVDHLLERLFPERQASADSGEKQQPSGRPWARMVANRDAVCSACGTDIAAGDEALAREADEGLDLRCLACGDTRP